MTTTIPASDLDLYHDAAILDPHRHYRELRAIGPVVWLSRYEVWAVTRYREVYQALHDHRTFRSGAGVGLTDRLNQAQKGSCITSDPPYHTQARALVSRHLTPKALRRFHDYVRQWADRLVDELIGRGAFDAVTDFGQAFPLSLVPDLLGWPVDEGRERLLDWASAGFNALGPPNERTLSGVPLLQEMGGFLHRMSIPGNLRPDSWGARLVADAHEVGIDEHMLPALLGDFLVPSLDTSVSALAGMLHLLGAHPDQWDAVRADESLIPNAFNEVLRVESPLRGFTRLVARDCELGGVALAEGTRVLLLNGSANRDEHRWADPDTFDVRRPDAAEHLAFGHGVHGCVGQGLSRLEAHSLLRSLAARVRRIEVGEPEWRLHNTIRGIARMDVVLHT
ncbi:cytochrome P450 [Saccharothrix syringae]|uniref:Cytochrome P450 n=1 Tax=Saccharothrix syringae TaxID=103733 RepID=A0A5Q0H5D3_SACSY|nr:cytochrome P450 [Saccharothrix syringae]QFZ21448.1 cytochrome P450 [Saccharothrix syringae]